MTLLARLNEKNDVPVHDIHEDIFKTFGRIVTGYDTEELLSYMENQTEIPKEGNVYIASVPEMEKLPVKDEIEAGLYGGMPVEIGYCNGRNATYNGFEYHKGSEINIAVTDFMLVLGHRYDIRDNRIDGKDATVFLIKRGSVIELFQTTLHLSPLRVTDEGFKAIVILPKGTNTPLSEEEKRARDEIVKKQGETCEERLLLQRNKWVLSHPEREPLMKQGAYPGFLGENKELFY